MKNSILIILSLIFLLINYDGVISAQNSKAPDFNLFTTDGKIFRLSKQLDKVVLLNFFETDCPSCLKEIKDLLALEKYFNNKNIQFVGIICNSSITSLKLKEFIMANKIDYKLLYATKSVIKDYDGVKVIPSTFIINQQGAIAQHYLGYMSYEQLKSELEKCLKLKEMKMQ